MSAEGYLVAGRYRLTRRIGSGAMGVVWQAQDERLGRTVAVKQLLVQAGLDPDEAEEARARTMREGRIAARLHHPNAVSVYDVVDDQGSPCLVMEYLPSRSLDDVLSEHGALPPTEVARIGAGVAAALAAAHAAGIVHRDIKPANVLLGQNGIVKITDFGISRATDDVTVTKTGLIAGTPAYLAPEVAIGREPKPPSDVFSLGSTLYTAVEGDPPFGLSENTLSLLHAVAAGRINPPRQAGPLTDVLLGLLRVQPEDRPDSPRAARMLAQVSNGEIPDIPGASLADAPTRAIGATGTRPGTTAVAPMAEEDYAEPPPPARSRKAMIIGILVALLVLGAVLFLLLVNPFADKQLPSKAPESSSSAPSSAPESSAPVTTTEETTTEEEAPPPPPTETTTTTTTTTEDEPPPSEPEGPPDVSIPGLPGGGNGDNGGDENGDNKHNGNRHNGGG